MKITTKYTEQGLPYQVSDNQATLLKTTYFPHLNSYPRHTRLYALQISTSGSYSIIEFFALCAKSSNPMEKIISPTFSPSLRSANVIGQLIALSFQLPKVVGDRFQPQTILCSRAQTLRYGR